MSQPDATGATVPADTRDKIIKLIESIQAGFNDNAGQLLAQLRLTDQAGPILSLCEDYCQATRDFSSQIHRIKMQIDWGHPESPKWMNHYQDWFFQTLDRRLTFWLERGIFARLSFGENAEVLELCSGDGFNTKYFYSPYAKNIKAIDYDIRAHQHAKKFHQWQNIEYFLGDITTQMPQGDFDNVVWDAAIECFSDKEIEDILLNIRARLVRRNGVLAGYTLVDVGTQRDTRYNQTRKFQSKADLHSLLTRVFPEVKVFETFSQERHNLVFYASMGGKVPFHDGWERMVG